MMGVKEEMTASSKRKLRVIVETYGDVQGIRMATEHRIRTYAEHEGLVAVLGEVAAEASKMAGIEAYKADIRKHKDDPAFTLAFQGAVDKLEDDQYHKKVNKLMKLQEGVLKNMAMAEVKEHPLWNDWLKYVYGIGPCLAGGIIARALTSVERSAHVSQHWAYAGLAVVMDKWLCHACKHEVEHRPEYMQKDLAAAVRCPKCQTPMAPVGHAQRRVKGQQSDFNERLKVLYWKIGESFVKQSAAKSGYRRLYDQMRAKVERDGCSKIHLDDKKRQIPCFDAHKFAKAKRLTVKIFASHVWQKGRELLGLSVADPFIFWKGHDKSGYIAPIYDLKPETGTIAEE